MTEYVSIESGSPIHIVREFGKSMVVITECGRRLSFPLFEEEPGEPFICIQCWNRSQK